MKTLREKIESKLEKQHSELDSSIKWLNVRRFISGGVIVLSAAGMHAAGADGGLLLFIFFTFPALIIYALQTNKERKLKSELMGLEKTILSSKE